jgi:serine/threonine protein kinase
VREFAIDDGGTAHIFMPFMEHLSLDDVMRRNKFALTQTVRTIAIFGITIGMSLLHAGGFVHYDIKPGNVLMNKMFEPALSDFGIAEPKSRETWSCGTYLYMAPALMGQQPIEDRCKCDVYSFAVSVCTITAEELRLGDGQSTSSLFLLPFLGHVSHCGRFARLETIPNAL